MNESRNGYFIAFEGTEGSGKTTQCGLLKDRLTQLGHNVLVIDFPQYDEPSSYFVREYRSGSYGSPQEVGSYTSSLFYSLDRFQASKFIREALNNGKIVLANRFIASTMAQHGTSFQTEAERRGYYIWLDSLEFQMLKIPRPDESFVLRVPADIAEQLIDNKPSISETKPTKEQLQQTIAMYDEMVSLFPKDFTQIDSISRSRLRTANDINDEIWKSIKDSLPEPSGTSSANVANVKLENPFVSKNSKGTFVITEKGHEFLSKVVTNTKSNVYAFSEELSPVTVAAAMARLSRRGDDMRITILDEFAQNAGKDAQLLQRVITAYGDDSVQQLVGQHVVVENASNLLTKKLEWGRLAAYLEQSTRYIYYDQKDAKGKYKYYVPKNFDKKTRTEYIKTMDVIFDLYSKMVRELTDYIGKKSTVPENERDVAWRSAVKAQACDAVRATLPVAVTSTVGIYASGQALESLIMHLLSDETVEARDTGKLMLDESRKIISTFLERADKPDRGGATIAYRANTRTALKELADKNLPDRFSADHEPVILTDFWPRNEIDIVADILYEHSSLSLQEIREEVEKWDYDQKYEVFKAAIGERLNRRHRPGRAFEKIHYSWDLVCDYGIFRDLQRHRMVDDLEWQALSPRYGYEVPELIDEAGLTEEFEHCFDLSLALYSHLQSAGYTLEAQYATLLGHKMRWKVTYNARAAFHFHELRTAPQGHPGYRKLVKQMHDRVAEVHPLVADAMIFVNKDEDPELTRLAAERYTQYKLKKLQ